MNQREQQGTGLAAEQSQIVNRREQQEIDLAAEQSQTVNRREQEGTSLAAEYIFSLKTDDTASRKTDESCCHRDFS
jgi:hypothetical protein